MDKELHKTTVSNEYVENIIRSMFDSLVVATPDGNIKIVNKAICELLGYRSEELVGQPVEKLFSHETTRSENPWLNELFKKSSIINIEKTCLAKDGRKIPVLLSISTMCDDKGNIIGIVLIAKDITERKQMEEALHHNEEHLRSITENVLDIITVIDKYGTINYESPSVERVLGYKPEELIGGNAFDLIYPEDIPAVMGAITEGTHNPGSPQSIDYRFKHKNGSWRILESVGKVIIDKAGTIEIIVNSRDMTARKQADEARQISERKYSTLVEKGNDGIIIIEDGLLKFINSKMISIAGFPLAELIEKPFLDFVPIEYKEFVIDNYKKRLSGQEAPNNYEIEIISKEGKNIPVEINASLIDYEGKRAEMAIIRDITDRKRAELALREVNSHLKTLINHLHAGILVENENHTIMHVNRAFCDMFSLPVAPDLLTGMDCSQSAQQIKHMFIDPEGFVARIGTLLTNRQTVNDEVLDLADGRAFERDFIPVYFDEVFVGHMWQYRDITERKRTEKQIESSLHEKETLLKEIHHRVKNNMQIVSSLLDHQTQYIKEKNVINIFRESQNRIASMALVHEKLYQSKDLAKIDFHDYINDLVANIFQSYTVNANKITLNMNIENIQLDIDLAIPCGLIINELVTNSLKYAFSDGRNGEIKIVLGQMNDEMLELVICDNGIGISKDIDFRKTDSLGLHLVTILAENQLHGEINLNRSKGTEFQIRFRRIK